MQLYPHLLSFCKEIVPTWRTFRRDLEGETELSQNLIIHSLVGQVCERIAVGVEPVIVADREFAVAAFFRFLKEQHCHFVIRVDAEIWMLHECYSGPTGSSGVQRGGRRMWWPGARYGKEEQEPVNLFAVWAPSSLQAALPPPPLAA